LEEGSQYLADTADEPEGWSAMTITIQNEIQLWFDKRGTVEVRCGACGSKPETAKGAQDRDQAKYMLNCPKHGTLVEYGSPEELATDLSAIVQKWRV
jgi:hypothetical protein